LRRKFVSALPRLLSVIDISAFPLTNDDYVRAWRVSSMPFAVSAFTATVRRYLLNVAAELLNALHRLSISQ